MLPAGSLSLLWFCCFKQITVIWPRSKEAEAHAFQSRFPGARGAGLESGPSWRLFTEEVCVGNWTGAARASGQRRCPLAPSVSLGKEETGQSVCWAPRLIQSWGEAVPTSWV